MLPSSVPDQSKSSPVGTEISFKLLSFRVVIFILNGEVLVQT